MGANAATNTACNIIESRRDVLERNGLNRACNQCSVRSLYQHDDDCDNGQDEAPEARQKRARS
jgi:hypothetical protein